MNEAGFQIKLADRIIGVTPLSGSLKEFCRDYLAESAQTIPSDFSVTLTSEDLARERALSETEERQVKTGGKPATDGYLETLSLARRVTEGLLAYDTILLHGSCLALDGEGYLFTAPSGVGKSTHAGFWRARFGERVQMINDDKPFLGITERGVTAYGSPWDGGHHLSTNTGVPLKAICLLERDRTNHIVPISEEEAYPMLFRQTYRPKTAGASEKLLPLVGQLAAQVNLYTLYCNMDPEAAEIAYEGMNS